MTNQRINDVDTITTISGTDRILVNTDIVNNVLEQIEKDDFIVDIISTDSGNLLDVGTDSKLAVIDSTITLQGNTFNGNSQLIQTTSAGLYPALDGSLITNISGGGGVVDFDNKGTVTTNITLTENVITTGYWSGTNTITLPTVTDTTKQVTCILDFTTASTGQPTITNTNLKWDAADGGKAPSAYSTLSGVINVLTFKSYFEGATQKWAAEYTTYGGVETAFVQPTLSADGVLGGSTFAVYASSTVDTRVAYKAADNNSSTVWCPAISGGGYFYVWYNPFPLKVSSINISNRSDVSGVYIIGYTLYGSNDNSTWVTLVNGTNNVTGQGASWIATIPEGNRGFYKYIKMYISSASDTGDMTQGTLNSVYIST